MPDLISPALIMVVAALAIGPARGHLRSAVVLLAPLLTLWAVWQVPDGVQDTVRFLSYQIEPVEGSPLRRLFATIFALMAFVGGLFAFRLARWHELAAAYFYAAGAIGVSFAGDLISLFVYWELMALFSTVVVWCGGVGLLCVVLGGNFLEYSVLSSDPVSGQQLGILLIEAGVGTAVCGALLSIFHAFAERPMRI